MSQQLIPTLKLQQIKKDVIDYAFTHLDIHSFADIGAVWGVDAGYTFHTLDTHNVQKAYIVDKLITENVKQKAENYPQLEIVRGNFGDILEGNMLPPVDCVFLFDVLFHQAIPSWKNIIQTLSGLTRTFVIRNPHYLGEKTVHLFDLGKEEYFRLVPHSETDVQYVHLFEMPNKPLPNRDVPRRDSWTIWQWGITDGDLISTMNQCGFTLKYFRNDGLLGQSTSFENHAYIFEKTKQST